MPRLGAATAEVGNGPLSRPQLSEDFVDAHKRRRTLIAIAELAQGRGIDTLNVAEICTAAKMGRATFYRLFGSREGALEYAFREAFDRTFGPVETAAGEPGAWLERVDAGLGALFEAIAEEPHLAELCLNHSVGAPAATGHDLEAGVRLITALMEGGREADGAMPGPPERSALTGEWLARGALALAALRIRQGTTAELPAHRPELVLMAANSYLPPERAAEAWQALAGARLPGADRSSRRARQTPLRGNVGGTRDEKNGLSLTSADPR